jgi:phage-related protein
MAVPRFTLEFYKDAAGRKPVLDWLRNKVSISTRRVVGTALREILQEQGMGVCGTAFWRQLGGGLFEFRLREGKLLLRAFCHAYGDKVILLLAAYDKRRTHQQNVSRRRLSWHVPPDRMAEATAAILTIWLLSHIILRGWQRKA